MLEVIVLLGYNWIVVYLEKLWANFPLLKEAPTRFCYLKFSNIKRKPKKSGCTWLEFSWAEPSSQIIGISIQLAQHLEKRIKILLAWLWTLLKYLESDRIQVATNLRYFHGWSNYFYRNIWLDFQDFAGGFFFSTSIGSQSRILMGKEGKFNNFASSWDPSSNGHARIPPSLRSSWAIQDRYQFQSCWDLGLLIPSALN